MNDDPAATVVLGLLAAYACALVALVAIAVGIVAALGYGVFIASRAMYRALQGGPVRRELRRVDGERGQAIRQISRIRQDAVRRMQQIADEDIVDGYGKER